LLTLASLVLLELGVSSIRRTFWPTDTDVFQELQKDRIIRQRFETIRVDQEGGEVEIGRDEKTSAEVRRESEIQELLDRPRVMDGGADVVRSPVETSGGSVGRRASGGNLTRRKFSVDVSADADGMWEFSPRSAVPPKMRHSLDIAEALGKRS